MRKFDMTPTLGNKPLAIPPTLLESVSVLSLPDGARIDGVFRWVTPDPLDADYHTLPTELYFRGLMELDLDDDEAVFGFCSRHGMTHDCASGWSDLGLAEGQPFGSTRAHQVQAAVQRLIDHHPDTLGDQSWRERRVYHVDEVRLRLARIRNVARTCSYLEGVITQPELAEMWDEGRDGVPDDREDARAFVCRSLSHAMSSVHPVLAVSDEVASRQTITLLSGLALQIYNDIVQGAPFRRCPHCDRLFVRHRSGKIDEEEQYQLQGNERVVRFCSKGCAQSHASKQYRLRTRAKTLRDRGLTVDEAAESMGLSRRDVELLLQAEGRDRSSKKGD